MPVVLVGTPDAAVSGSASVSSTLPAGIADGDVGYAAMVYNHSTGDPTTPNGWTQIDEHTFSGSMRARLYSRTMVTTDAGTVVTFTRASVQKTALAVAVLRGADAASMVLAAQSGDDDCPVADPTGSGVGVAFWLQRGGTVPVSVAAPAGFTLHDSAFNTGTGQTCSAVATNMTEAPSQGGGTWAPNVANTGTITYTLAVPAAASVSERTAPFSLALAGSVVANETNPSRTAPFALSLTATATLPATPVSLLTYPAYAAHRGGANMTNRVENTLESYVMSIANDAPQTVLEMDCSYLGAGGGATEEDRICLTHEGDNLATDSKIVEADGVTIVTGLASSKTVAQWDTYLVKPRSGITSPLRQATRWPAIVALLKANPGKIAMPEMKEAGTVTPLINSIIANGIIGQTIVQSFDYGRCATAAAAGLNVCWLTSDFSTTSPATAYAAGIRWVGFDRTNGNLAALCTAAQTAGLKVWSYTINNTTNRDVAAAAGVDAFFTDVPSTVNATNARSAPFALALVATATGAGSGGSAARTAPFTLALGATAARVERERATAAFALSLSAAASGSGSGGTSSRTAPFALTLGSAAASVEREATTAPFSLGLSATADANAAGGVASRTAPFTLTLVPTATAQGAGGAVVRTAPFALNLGTTAARVEREVTRALFSLTVTAAATATGSGGVASATAPFALQLVATAHAVNPSQARDITLTGRLLPRPWKGALL